MNIENTNDLVIDSQFGSTDFDESDSHENSASKYTSHPSKIVNELTEEIENLQSKLKLSYRKLILFETENQKLASEKNAFFFENKMLQEHNKALAEQNKKLSTYNEELEVENEKQLRKIEISEKLIETQKVELTRLSKFHLKIKNIIKPYVENLKDQNLKFKAEIEIQKKSLEQASHLKTESETKIENLSAELKQTKAHFIAEKNSIIEGYEEQIHFLSKEIVENQQSLLDIQNENFKLKKQCETKLFIENELVKYKRAQDEHLQSLHSYKIKETELNLKLNQFEIESHEKSKKLTDLSTEIENLEQVLESTRRQLSTKIGEIEDLHTRLKMFEKLNTHLSLSLQSQS